MMDRRDRDAGFTFVELLVASALSISVLVLAGWMLLASIQGGRDVTTSGTASSQAQLLTNSIRAGIGAAADVDLDVFADDGQVLKAAVAEFDGSGNLVGAWSCAYWAITVDGRAYTLRSPSTAVIPTSQTTTAFAGWTRLASGLERVSGAEILTRTPTAVGITARSDAAGGSPAFVETTVNQRPLPSEPTGVAC